MKLLITCFLTCFLLNAFGQASLYGKLQKEPVTLSNGLTVSVGDTVHFGRGTGPMGNFSYITNPANAIVGVQEIPFSRSWNGRSAVISQIRVNESKKFGKKTYLVVPTGRNALVDAEAAIEVGEVIAINQNKVGPLPQQTATTTGGVADELLKLKQLLDAGALTQSEYDTQKAKLLKQ